MQKKDEETTDRLKPLRDWLDVAAKSVIAGITIWFGFLASDYKSKVEATTLLSERERAESDLRAGMMRDLVPRFMEQQSGQSPSDLHRARVFLELLTLNFHTHMEMKPLLLELDSRIAGQLNRKQNKSDLDQLEDDRKDLRSVARRVLDRQVEMLAASEAAAVPASTSSQGSEQPVSRRSLLSVA